MKNRTYSLLELTGLSDEIFADVLANNSRAYMAVKGAVAEKHLEIILERERTNGNIKAFKPSSGDFDKDFYVTLNNDQEISVECKNIEVIKTSTKKSRLNYLKFSATSEYLNETDFKATLTEIDKNYLDETSINLENSIVKIIDELDRKKSALIKELMSKLPKHLTQSGIPRYEFSSSLIENKDLDSINKTDFLKQFDPPLTIDFQRTRNSKSSDGEEQRFYKIGEIDVVAACLFSRTLKWDFIFCHSKNFPIHNKFPQRYTNKLKIIPELWHSTLLNSML